MSLDAVQTPRLGQFLHSNGLRRVQTALVDPRLDPVEVDGRHFHLEWVVLPPPTLWVGDPLRRLPTLEACGHFAVRMLALLTPASRLSLA